MRWPSASVWSWCSRRPKAARCCRCSSRPPSSPRRRQMVADALQGYYAARAPEYDRVYDKPERQADLRAIEAWLPTVFAGSRLLEVACGTGYWSRFLAPVVQQMLGVDASAQTLAIAQARVTAAHARFAVGNAYSLPVG